MTVETGNCFIFMVTLIFFNRPLAVPSKVMKRKSLSAGGQKRRSLLPTPMRNNKVTKSQSQKLNSSSKKFGSQGCLPFNISPSSESIVPRIAGGSSDSPVDAKAEVLKSTSSLSDPFSPVPQTISAHPVIDSCASGDSLPTNLIELSPTLPTEVSDHNWNKKINKFK